MSLFLGGLLLIVGLGCSSGSAARAGGESSQSAANSPRESKPRRIRTKVDDHINPLAMQYFVNGSILEAAGQYSHAMEQYKRALQYHPTSHEIRLAMARMTFSLRQYENTLDLLKVIHPEDDPVQRMRAACFHELGQPDSAAHYYLESVRLDSTNTAPYAYLAAIYQNREMLDSTIWAYRNLSRLRPDDQAIWYELGRLYTRSGDFTTAQQAFREAIGAGGDDPSNMMAYVRIGELYEARRMKDSAMAMFKEALDRDPDNMVLNRILATHYIQTDSFEVALPYTRSAAEAAPMERTAQRRLALVYYVLDSLNQADSILTDLVESGDNNPANFAYLGRIGVKREDLPMARENFEAAVQVADTALEAYLDLGWVYSELGQTEKEIELYRVGLNKVRDSAATVKLLLSLGATLEQDNQIQEAIGVLQRALELAPDDPVCLNFLGYLLADNNMNLEYARDLIERAVEQDPGNAAFLDSYGWVYYRLGEFDNALTHLQQAAELDKDPTILDHLGDAYNATGQEQKARQWWRKALDLDPDNDSIREKLSE